MCSQEARAEDTTRSRSPGLNLYQPRPKGPNPAPRPQLNGNHSDAKLTESPVERESEPAEAPNPPRPIPRGRCPPWWRRTTMRRRYRRPCQCWSRSLRRYRCQSQADAGMLNAMMATISIDSTANFFIVLIQSPLLDIDKVEETIINILLFIITKSNRFQNLL